MAAQKFYKKASRKVLEKNLEDMRKESMNFELENTMLQCFIDEIPPPPYPRQRLSDPEPEDDDPIARKNYHFSITPNTLYRRLDPKMKCYIAHKEYQRCKNHVSETKKHFEEIINRYEIALQGYMLEIKDLRKAASELEQFLQKKGYNEQTQYIAAEKFESYLRGHLQKRNEVYDAVNLQNGVLLCRLRKLRAELQTKSAEREIVTKCDYDKLVVVNKDLMELLINKMAAVDELKRIDSNQSRDLNTKRAELDFQMKLLIKLRGKTGHTLHDIETVTLNIDQTHDMIFEESQQKKRLSRMKDQYKIRTIQDLIDYCEMNHMLTNELKKHTRQMYLAKNDFERYRELSRRDRNTRTGQSFTMGCPEPTAQLKSSILRDTQQMYRKTD